MAGEPLMRRLVRSAVAALLALLFVAAIRQRRRVRQLERQRRAIAGDVLLRMLRHRKDRA